MRASWIRWIPMILIASTPLAAQDSSRVSLVIGLHGPGVLISSSRDVAFRFDGTVSESSSSGIDVWSGTIGMSGLFYLRSWDALRSYVGPRVSYSYTGSGANTKTWSGQFFFGTEYALGRRFGLFGELGPSYGRSTGTRVAFTGETVPTPSTTFWSIASGVGLLFRL